MARQYNQKQLKELFNKLPEELQETIFSIKTSEAITDASENNGVSDKRVTEIARYTGQVLMGLLLASEFEQILQKEVGLSKSNAKAIAQEINRFVFYPVKPALDQLHEMETGTAVPGATTQKAVSERESTPVSKKKDLYRETIEKEE